MGMKVDRAHESLVADYISSDVYEDKSTLKERLEAEWDDCPWQAKMIFVTLFAMIIVEILM